MGRCPAVTVVPESAGSGDQTDSNELVRTHLPLVGHLVREMLVRLPGHVRRDELVSAGTLALVMSARAYDADRGVPFARFAGIRIRGALIDELRSMDWASRGVRSGARDLDRVRERLAVALGRTPTRVEIAQAMGIGARELATLEADLHRASVLSLQALAATSEQDPGPATADDPESLLVRREELGQLRGAIGALPPRLRLVVEAYFFDQRKLADIAQELGVTESRVSQLRSEALGRLRTILRDGEQRADVAPTPRRAPVRCGTVSTPRSTPAARLALTTLMGEPRPALASVG